MAAPGLSRRAFLALAAVVGAGAVSGLPRQNGRTLFFSAASDTAGGHWLNGFTLDDDGVALRVRHRLPGRGHDVAVHEGAGLFIGIARRPGTFLLIGDLASGAVVRTLSVPAGRHLYGHGVFSADGRYFYTTESDFENMTGDSGLVAVWEVVETASGRTLKRLREFPTGGVGPHELLLMPDGQTLAIANGGIRTHPDSERDKLNIDTMAPSLVFMNRDSGALSRHYRLPADFHQASIRHIDVNGDGRIAIAMQYEGLPFHNVPLVATQRGNEEIRPLAAPEAVRIQMRQYVGSVRFDTSGRFFAASCPRGNMVTFWDCVEGAFVGQVRSRDGCGISAVEGGFVITAGSTGKVRYYDLASGGATDFQVMPEQFPDNVFWDNHLSVV